MPMNLTDYPADWKRLSASIRTERAQNRCECTGQCGKDFNGERCNAENGQPHPITGSTVVLTVAHLCDDETCDDQKKTTRKCGNPNHLLAMCQRCHSNLDRHIHSANARNTRTQKKDAQRALLLTMEA